MTPKVAFRLTSCHCGLEVHNKCTTVLTVGEAVLVWGQRACTGTPCVLCMYAVLPGTSNGSKHTQPSFTKENKSLWFCPHHCSHLAMIRVRPEVVSEAQVLKKGSTGPLLPANSFRIACQSKSALCCAPSKQCSCLPGVGTGVSEIALSSHRPAAPTLYLYLWVSFLLFLKPFSR